LRIGIARVDVDRLDDVIADRHIIVADRLALGGEARQHRRRRRRAAQRQIEPELHPCPPRSSPSSFIANIVGLVHPRYFPPPTNTACEPNESRACRRGERCLNPWPSSAKGSSARAVRSRRRAAS